jgi:hypothetical protein
VRDREHDVVVRAIQQSFLPDRADSG